MDKGGSMTLIINGQTKDVGAENGSPTMAGLIGQFCKNKKNIMAELNGSIVSSAGWETTVLREGDQVELVAFVGGG